MRLNLPISRITDEATRSALQDIQDATNNSDVMAMGWSHFSHSVPNTVTEHRFYHNLGYVPSDVLLTRSTGSIQWHFEQWTKDYIVFSTSGPEEFRFLLGAI